MANEKKATVRDIAAKAGVSVATVSYVLNDKKDTKISDVTRKKVLQVANLLNYSIPEKYKNIDARKGAYTIGIMYQLKSEIIMLFFCKKRMSQVLIHTLVTFWHP